MATMIERIEEHIEFHENIDSHKSDVAFLNDLLIYVKDMEEDILNLKNSKWRTLRGDEKTEAGDKIFDPILGCEIIIGSKESGRFAMVYDQKIKRKASK